MKPKLNILQLSFVIFVVLIINVMNVSGQWQPLGGPPVAKDVRDISAGYQNGTFTIYAADSIKLSKSVDQGSNWTFINAMDSPLLVACSPTNSNTLLVAKGRDVYLSTNGGSSFIETPTVRNVDPLRLLYSRGDPRDAWVGTKYQAGKSSLRRSTDGGFDFREVQYFSGTAQNQPKTNVEDVWTVPNNPIIVWAAGSSPSGGVSGLWRSTDRGDNWSTNLTTFFNPRTQRWEKIISGNLTSVTTNPNGDQIYVGLSNGKIARYDTTYRTFHNLINLKDTIKQIRATNTKLFIASEAGFYVGSVGVSPSKVEQIEGEVLSIEIDPRNEGRIFVGTNQYVYVSTDSGRNFTPTNPKTTTATLNSKAVAVSGNVILAIAERSKNNDAIYRYNGTEWSAVDMAFAKNKFFIGKGNTIGNGFYRHSADTIFVFGRIEDGTKDSALIAVSYNNGVSWNRLMINAGRSGAIINGMIRWKDTLFAYGEIGGSSSTTVNLIKSSNNFTTWTSAKSIGQHEVYSMVEKDNNNAYAGTEKGLFVTHNGGINWDHRPSATRIGASATEQPGKAFNIIRKGYDIFLASDKGLFKYNTVSAQKNILRTKIHKQLLAHPGKDSTIYALVERTGNTNRDTILKSIDRGDRWTAEPVITTAYDIRKITLEDSVLYAATDRGLHSDHSHKQWASGNIPPPSPTTPSNIIWESGSTVLISGTPTIPEGSCLTIEPGVKVMFTPGAQLRIQGELSVQGTREKKVLFVSESPTQRWGGIYIGKEAKANIDYAEISGATFGIFVSKSNAEISNTKIQNSLVGIGFYGSSYEPPVIDSCRLENNAWGLVALAGSKAIIKNSNITGGQKGVLVDASSPEFYGNTISNNTQVGVVIYGLGYPRFGGIAPNQPGSNTIQNNGITQILAVKGYAFLGYGSGSSMLGGANIITSTDIYTPLAVALDNSVISAMGTYWGPQQTNKTNFLLDGSSQMIYEPVMDPEVIEQLLMDALQYRASGMYQNAIANYQQIISGDGTIIQALVELRETYADMLAAGVDQTNQWLSYLQTLQTHYNPPMARTATTMIANEYANADMLDEALEKYQHALTLVLDTETRISVLFSKMMLEGFELSAEGDAEETYLNMKQQFPNDERTQLAQFELELISGAYSSVEFGKVSEFKVAMRELPKFPKADQKLNSIPKEFRIEQNYPNPFNPSTLIKYQIPQANKVEIKIYNIFGQEVKKLVDEVQDAGYYEIVWNSNNNSGNQVASGVYFYRLTAGSFSETKKLILMR